MRPQLVFFVSAALLISSTIASSPWRGSSSHLSAEDYGEGSSWSDSSYQDRTNEEIDETPQIIRIPRMASRRIGNDPRMATRPVRQFLYKPVATHQEIKQMINDWPAVPIDFGLPDNTWTNEFSDGSMMRINLNFARRLPPQGMIEDSTTYMLSNYCNRIMACALLSGNTALHQEVVDYMLSLVEDA